MTITEAQPSLVSPTMMAVYFAEFLIEEEGEFLKATEKFCAFTAQSLREATGFGEAFAYGWQEGKLVPLTPLRLSADEEKLISETMGGNAAGLFCGQVACGMVYSQPKGGEPFGVLALKADWQKVKADGPQYAARLACLLRGGLCVKGATPEQGAPAP